MTDSVVKEWDGGAQPRDRGLVLIAAFKMAKAVFLILAGLGAFSLLRPGVADGVRQWLTDLTNLRALRSIQGALAFLRVARPSRIEEFGVFAVCYGLLFAAEGVGLWQGRRWAEYLTVVTTSLLIPLEIYELSRRLTALRGLTLALNIALVVYLIVRLRHPRKTSGRAG